MSRWPTCGARVRRASLNFVSPTNRGQRLSPASAFEYEPPTFGDAVSYVSLDRAATCPPSPELHQG